MLFIIMGNAKAGTTKERVARRVKWQYPKGIKVVAEYWLMATEPRLIIAAEAEDVASIMRATVDWDDVFDMTVIPAMTAEQGLELAKQMQAGSPA